jgi:hypothetical protein
VGPQIKESLGYFMKGIAPKSQQKVPGSGKLT